MHWRTVKLLLIEPDPDDALLVKEALMEVEQRQQGQAWSPLFEPLHLERLEDALAVLGEERFDAALLDVQLPDSHSLHAYLRLREAAPDTAILLLGRQPDEALILSALREGAQDFLLTPELDSGSLARALRNGCERQRLLNAARSEMFRDPGAGLYATRAFHELGERDFAQARRLGCDQILVLVRLEGLNEFREAHGIAAVHLLKLEAAEAVRKACSPGDLVGIAGDALFGIARLDSKTGCDRLALRIKHAFRRVAPHLAVTVSATSVWQSAAADWNRLFQQAQAALCENKREIAPAGRNERVSVS